MRLFVMWTKSWGYIVLSCHISWKLFLLCDIIMVTTYWRQCDKNNFNSMRMSFKNIVMFVVVDINSILTWNIVSKMIVRHFVLILI